MKTKPTFHYLLAALCLGLLLTGCGRLIVGGNPENTPSVNFDYFTDAVRENYSFFAEKKVSWDSLEQRYRPLINDEMGNDSLYLVFAEMLRSLRDGHVNFYADRDRSRNHDWIYDHPANFDGELIQRRYLGRDYYASGALFHNWLRDSIGYVQYNSFGSKFSGRQLSFALNRYAAGRGLILDLRGNGGGSMSRMYTIVRRFLSEPTFVGTMQYKNGPGPNDFSVPDSIHLEPTKDYVAIAKARAEREAKRQKKGKPALPEPDSAKVNPVVKTNKWAVPDTLGTWQRQPVVVLTGRRTYSAANFCAAFLSTLPNVTLIGDRSGGGGGVPVSFELPNGWTFRLSATRTYLPDGTDIEEGIEPDIYQPTGYEEALAGKDLVIERALEVLAAKR